MYLYPIPIIMREIISILLVFVCPTVFSQSKDIEILKKLNKDWLDSYAKKDTITLNRIFADDFTLISHNGTKMTKNDIIHNLDKQKVIAVNTDSIDVRLLTGNVGVVIAYTTFVLNVDGKEMTGQNCYQDVYVKKKGKWVAALAHVTLLNFK